VDDKGRLIWKDTGEKVSDSEEHILIHVESVRKQKEAEFGIELESAPHYQQTPKEEFIRDAVGYTALITGISVNAIRSSLKDREVADARKIIAHLCRDMGLLPSQIHKKTGFDRGGVYTMISKCDELLETNEDFKSTYKAVKKATLEANGIKYSENGEKLKT
jgi:chromosomal replication initiation ATPase DnaA